jgi:tetratricopeptide (TPR) repeat protein
VRCHPRVSISIALMLIALLASSAARANDSSPLACSSLADQAASYLSSAKEKPDSIDKALVAFRDINQRLAATCAAAAKEASSGSDQCQRAGGKWDAGQGKCQGFNNNNVKTFGGSVEQVTFCWNDAIYLRLADGTEVVWTPETKTFRNGPASRAVEDFIKVKSFAAGVTDKSFYCLAQKVPILVWTAVHLKALAIRPYRPDDDNRQRSDRAAAHAHDLDELNNKIAAYSQQLKVAPSDASTLAKRGNAYLGKADYSDAFADFNQVVALRPNDTGSWSNRCWARAIAGQDLNQALNDAGESLRLQSNAAASACRGLVFLRLGRLDEALADYDAALGINSKLSDGGGEWDAPSAWYGRGLAERQRRNEVAATLDFAAATAMAPTIADHFASYGFNVSDLPEVYGQRIGDMNAILMAPFFDSYVEAFYKARAGNTGQATASKLVGDSINGMLEAGTISSSDVDPRKICGAPAAARGKEGDEVAQSLKCFFLVLDRATRKYAPEQDLEKYNQLMRGAMFGLENSTH